MARKFEGFLKNAGNVEAIIAPPFVFLDDVKKEIKLASMAAQDCFWDEKGAYTGEISVPMLKSKKITHVIIGHSERRFLLGETDSMVSRKLAAALDRGMSAILCVGEPASVRGEGIDAAKRYVEYQLKQAFGSLSSKALGRAIIAYEPIWAVGSGSPDSPASASEMAMFIKSVAAASPFRAEVKVLYGGSVDVSNIKSFVEAEGIDGVLVGGAGIVPSKYRGLIKNIQI